MMGIFWEVLEGIIGKISSILGSGLLYGTTQGYQAKHFLYVLHVARLKHVCM